MKHQVTYTTAKTKDIYKMNATICNCVIRSSYTSSKFQKREYVMFETLSGTFNVVLLVTYVT